MQAMAAAAAPGALGRRVPSPANGPRLTVSRCQRRQTTDDGQQLQLQGRYSVMQSGQLGSHTHMKATQQATAGDQEPPNFSCNKSKVLYV
jgi:hypothetical protein